LAKRGLIAALVALLLVAGIALLASAGSGGSEHMPDSAAASVVSCARTPAPSLFAHLPAGMRAAPLDSLIAGAVSDQLALPPDVAAHLEAREIDAGSRRLAGVLVAPVGERRASIADAFAARAAGDLPREVQLARGMRGTLIALDASGRHVVAVLAFTGCRAVVVGAGDEGTTLRVASALFSGGG